MSYLSVISAGKLVNLIGWVRGIDAVKSNRETVRKALCVNFSVLYEQVQTV